ncbi:DUF58 domain-containing protein [Parachitinimonas caeni]|uniref:DUF58 domain-containing protein n=1 Tax=Parachitinimonas caeni TaxID=3031301 RepID=A0ABT7DWU3_9NEIS|nr:DUF58 domain-containing protein [Parachitinimonas caeni]MDK2123640.1 DUF58 domain-containing protein [Parachitinimonas caeni]
MSRFRESFKRLRQSWFVRRHKRIALAIRLEQRRVYIFLTRPGIAFCLILLAMLGGSVNYDLSLGYILVFLLGSMTLVSIFHTFRNLLNLSLQPGRCDPAFVGEAARFEVLVENSGNLVRRNVQLIYEEGMPVAADIEANSRSALWMTLPAQQRGWLVPPRLTVYTAYPLGLFRAWSYCWFDQRCLVYPRPELYPPELPDPGEGDGPGAHTRAGHDDFAGLRQHTPSDSPRHIAWKAAARDETLLLTKQWSGEVALSLWLEWDMTGDDLDVEARLSRLTAWVLDAEARELTFGLRLPGKVIEPDRGGNHLNACLAALALYGVKS